MPSVELLRAALRALAAHKLRSFLTALGIVISVWTIVSVASVIGGMNDYVANKVFSLAPDVFVVTQFGIITSREEFLDAIKRKPLTPQEAAQLRRLCESCAEVGEVIDAKLPVRAGNRRIADVDINGATANVAGLMGIDLEAGRFFTDSEEARRAMVAVIGSDVREELFPRLDPLGRTVWIRDVPHTVIGLLAKQGSMLGQNRDLVVYTPYGSAEKQFGLRPGRTNDMALLVRAAEGVPGVVRTQQEVIQIFRWLRHTPIRGSDPVGVVTAEMVQELWRKISFATFAFVGVITGISLFVGAIVVANIMLVSVIERTREIGLRLALGARKRDVRRQFLLEAASLAAGGGALGSALGAVTALVVNEQSPLPASVRLWSIVAAIAIAGGAGLVAGFFPARKAANLQPIEALRHE